MSVLLDLGRLLIQEGRVDELLTLHGTLVGLLHSVWVALNTVGCVAGHELTGGVITMRTARETKAWTVLMWMVCL